MHLLKFEQHELVLQNSTQHTAFESTISFVSYFYNTWFLMGGIGSTNIKMAERVGFEPTIPLTVYKLSKRVPKI